MNNGEQMEQILGFYAIAIYLLLFRYSKCIRKTFKNMSTYNFVRNNRLNLILNSKITQVMYVIILAQALETHEL